MFSRRSFMSWLAGVLPASLLLGKSLSEAKTIPTHQEDNLHLHEIVFPEGSLMRLDIHNLSVYVLVRMNSGEIQLHEIPKCDELLVPSTLSDAEVSNKDAYDTYMFLTKTKRIDGYTHIHTVRRIGDETFGIVLAKQELKPVRPRQFKVI